MTKHLTLLLILSVGFSQQEYNIDDLIEMDDGLWTVKFSDEPVTGKVFGYFGEQNNPKKVYIGNLRNGKKEGKMVFYYHSTGKKSFESNYKDGELDGLKTNWHENGQREQEATYKDGELDGLITDWYENGQKWMEVAYKDGKVILGMEWNRDGSIKETLIEKKGDYYEYTN